MKRNLFYNKHLIMKKIFLVFTAIAAAATLRAQEPLMDILRSELDYEYGRLAETSVPPYYMSFRVTDIDVKSVSASFGVLTSSYENRERVFKPQIRLGDYAFDNFRGEIDGMQNQNRTQIPLSDENPDAVRQVIWGQVQEDYKASIEHLERVRASDKVNTKRDDKAPDFSSAPVEKYYEAPPAESDRVFDRPELERRVKAYSAVFLGNPNIINGSASINFTVLRKYLMSSEGTEIAHNNLACRLMINCVVRTSDGMELPLYKDYFAFTPAGLPDDETVLADARGLAETLAKMKDAPVVDPYTGPALLSGQAAGVFFHEIFGHRIEGQRMKSDSDGQTFKKMVGQGVLPKNFNIYDDPTLAQFGDRDLYGYYLYDDQGVAARRVNVVKNGTLNEFLMTRVPTDEFGQSNGHARANEMMNPVSRQSNLVIEPDNLLTSAQLRKQLIKAAKSQGRDFALYFKEVTGGFTITGRFVANSFNVTPLEVYKVYVDGRPDELVRGVDLIGTPLSMFSSIANAGGEAAIFTGVCGAESGGVPVTAVSPQILVEKVEVQRKAKSSNTPPVLSRPDGNQ